MESGSRKARFLRLIFLCYTLYTVAMVVARAVYYMHATPSQQIVAFPLLAAGLAFDAYLLYWVLRTPAQDISVRHLGIAALTRTAFGLLILFAIDVPAQVHLMHQGVIVYAAQSIGSNALTRASGSETLSEEMRFDDDGPWWQQLMNHQNQQHLSFDSDYLSRDTPNATRVRSAVDCVAFWRDAKAAHIADYPNLWAKLGRIRGYCDARVGAIALAHADYLSYARLYSMIRGDEHIDALDYAILDQVVSIVPALTADVRADLKRGDAVVTARLKSSCKARSLQHSKQWRALDDLCPSVT